MENDFAARRNYADENGYSIQVFRDSVSFQGYKRVGLNREAHIIEIHCPLGRLCYSPPPPALF